MKYLSFTMLFFLLILIQMIPAQIPRTISYQGVLTDAEGTTVPDDNYTLTFRLYEVATGGSVLWTETQTLPVTAGIFNAILGNETSLDLAFDKGYWLGITINSGSELTPRIEMTSSAYSLSAAAVADSCITAENIANGQVVRSINNLKDDVNLAPGNNISITPVDNTLTIAANLNGMGNTLDQAYDQGGPGAGRTIIADAGAFEVGGVDGALFKGIFGNGTIPAEGGGVRMMWYPAKAAFRVGFEINNVWANYNIGDYSTAGGIGTLASGSAATAMGFHSVASGENSTALGAQVTASSLNSTAIGSFTTASEEYATALGHQTTASGYYALAMGAATEASGSYSTVIGHQSTASGQHATSVGLATKADGYISTAIGYLSSARGSYSFAAGNGAKANHLGAIVIGANIGGLVSDSIASGGDEQMVLRADGSIYITNTSGQAPYEPGKLINTSSGAYLTTGGAWTDASDRNLKENFTSVNTAELLTKLKSLEISQWNYKSENPNIKHIGPVAQDFYAIFGVGNDDKSISTLDPAGIALATIQELEKRTSHLQTENQSLKEKIALLEQNLKKLEELLNR